MYSQTCVKRSLKGLKNCGLLKVKIFAPGEWYRCRRLAVVANSGVSTLGFKTGGLLHTGKLQSEVHFWDLERVVA